VKTPTNKKPVDVANSSWLQRQRGQLEGLVGPRRAVWYYYYFFYYLARKLIFITISRGVEG